MKINSSILARQLADRLDESDKKGKNGRIEASVWNEFVKDKGGKTISNYINIDNAIKSLIVYLCRQAKANSRLIVELGQEWINSLSDKSKTDDNADNSENSVKKSKTKSNKKKVDTSYSKMSKEKALAKAKNDSRLEKLTGGEGWSVSEASFITDIPYARKYTGEILSFVSSIIGENIVVTSALGTGGSKGKRSPHKISKNYCTHHNAENPKLDIRTNGNAQKMSKKLKATGLFSRVSIEPDHLDIQIKNEVYLAFEQGHDMNNILACAKNNNLGDLLA